MVGPQVRENLASGAGLRRVNGRETLNKLVLSTGTSRQ